MNSNEIVVAAEEGTFDRAKLQSLASDQKAHYSNVLDKVELIYRHLLPGKRRKIWIFYFTILVLFIGFGSYKHNLKHRPPPRSPLDQHAPPHHRPPREPGSPPHNPPQHHPQERIDYKEGSAPQAHLPPHEMYPEHFRNTRMPYYHKKAIRFSYFLVETFILVFPFYLWLSSRLSKNRTLKVIKELIEIENKVLKTKHQCKAEVKDLAVIAFKEFSEEKAQGASSDLGSELAHLRGLCSNCAGKHTSVYSSQEA